MLADIKPGAGGVDDEGTEELIEAFPPGEGTEKDTTGNNNIPVTRINDNILLFMLIIFYFIIYGVQFTTNTKFCKAKLRIFTDNYKL